jgi:nucleotide-binding universal stress UspA family protein
MAAQPRRLVVGYDGSPAARRDVQAVGDPADELIAAARELDADLVVLGRRNGRGRSAAEDSLDAAVLRRATCDVLVVTDRS